MTKFKYKKIAEELLNEVIYNADECVNWYEYITGEMMNNLVTPNLPKNIQQDEKLLNIAKKEIFEEFKSQLIENIQTWKLNEDE